MSGCSDGNTASIEEKEDKSESVFCESPYKTIYCDIVDSKLNKIMSVDD